jgi:hypothetical protein
MTDTTDKALDARIIRANPTDGMYAVQDGGWVHYEALIDLRRERDAALAREKALLASNQEERTALVEAASLRRERDALRAQLATAHQEADLARALIDTTAERDEALNQLDSALHSVDVLEKRVETLLAERDALRDALIRIEDLTCDSDASVAGIASDALVKLKAAQKDTPNDL